MAFADDVDLGGHTWNVALHVNGREEQNVAGCNEAACHNGSVMDFTALGDVQGQVLPLLMRLSIRSWSTGVSSRCTVPATASTTLSTSPLRERTMPTSRRPWPTGTCSRGIGAKGSTTRRTRGPELSPQRTSIRFGLRRPQTPVLVAIPGVVRNATDGITSEISADTHRAVTSPGSLASGHSEMRTPSRCSSRSRERYGCAGPHQVHC
jgi:hypothetical protein